MRCELGRRRAGQGGAKQKALRGTGHWTPAEEPLERFPLCAQAPPLHLNTQHSRRLPSEGAGYRLGGCPAATATRGTERVATRGRAAAERKAAGKREVRWSKGKGGSRGGGGEPRARQGLRRPMRPAAHAARLGATPSALLPRPPPLQAEGAQEPQEARAACVLLAAPTRPRAWGRRQTPSAPCCRRRRPGP